MGGWLSLKSLWELIPSQAAHYDRRFRKYHIGDAGDLQQAASVALLEWENANGKPERIRELTGLGLLHRAMVAEVRRNRKESVGGGPVEVGERRQLSDKQQEVLQQWVMIGSKAARKPNWECLWLRRVLGWSEQAISTYFRRKKDERAYYSPEQIGKMVRLAAQRIRKKMPPDLTLDVRLLQFYN